MLIETDGRFVVQAGDVVFDKTRIESGRAMVGIVEDIDAAKLSINTLENQISKFPTLVLTAHDIVAVNQLSESHIDKHHTGETSHRIVTSVIPASGAMNISQK